ncbi:MAG: hypothetical protein B7X57_10415 [Erythrobacter sp. 34-65-8]|nr:MAG: hypothetical protein B7X57_10415 [Erythrobacter sp. 34-65-8]
MLDLSRRFAYTDEHNMFRDTVRKVFAQHLEPFLDEHEKNGIVPREVWKAVGEAGLLCPTVKEENGGLGLDFGYCAVVGEEMAYLGSAAGFTLQSDITANYFERLGTAEQRAKYLPGMVTGDIITAIAMTEPGAGSDLQGIRTTAREDGGDYVINGSKTYITNGQNADVVIVVAKTDPAAGAKGTTLLLVEDGTPGFVKGRNLDKIGQHAADTSELFFEDVRVPKENVLGGVGRGFVHLMEELRKVKRVIQKLDPQAPHEVLLVLDANTGQNAVTQVTAFDDALGVTGLVLTKLDGTAKGGVIAAIAKSRPRPIRFIGVGEQMDDLRPFVAAEFVNALFEEPAA